MSEKEIQQIAGEIEQCLQTNDPFPVDFDDAWKWIGYSAKHKAKAKLLNNFDDEMDFSTIRLKSPSRGRPSEKISLTIDCFKSFAMMAGTERGRQVRRYFIDCERRMKALIEERSKRRLTQEEIESLLVITGGTKWKKRFDDGFYELMSRLSFPQINRFPINQTFT